MEAARDLYHDWAAAARTVVAGRRMYAGSHPNDPKPTELVGDLAAPDPDLRQWWAEHDVDIRDHGSKRYHHPVVGDLVLGYEAMTPVGEPEFVLGIHTVEAHPPSAEALALLAGWSAVAGPEADRTSDAQQAAQEPDSPT